MEQPSPPRRELTVNPVAAVPARREGKKEGVYSIGMNIPLDLGNISGTQTARASLTSASSRIPESTGGDNPRATYDGHPVPRAHREPRGRVGGPEDLATLAARMERLEAQVAQFDDLRAVVADLRNIAATFNRPKAEMLSKSEAARLLRVHRTQTLPKLIEAGVLKLIPYGKRECISRDDIERVKRDGLLPVYAPKVKQGRRPKRTADPNVTLDSWRPTPG